MYNNVLIVVQTMHAPYPPRFAAVGGRPTIDVDVPITAVFLFLFICGAVGHMTILQLNLRKKHKFIMSGLTFGFCMARIVTMIMRIVWACYPDDVQIAIAAQIFVSAGVLILFLINLIFAQRILRAAHPHFGWHRALSWAFNCLYALIVVMLVIVITATVQSFYTRNANILRIDRDLQLTAGTYLMFISFLPIPMVVLGLLLPRQTRVDKFGTGRWRTKIAILLTSSVLLCLGAAFRAGTNFKTPRPVNDPAWYQAKWCFYFFNFTVEILVVFLYLALRVDRRFHVPDGSRGSYSQQGASHDSREDGRPTSNDSVMRIMSEEEVFDDKSPVTDERPNDVESGSRIAR
jgi:hypothetical protein